MINAQEKAFLDQYFAERIQFLGIGITTSIDPNTKDVTHTLDNSGDWTGTIGGLTLTQILDSASSTAASLDTALEASLKAFVALTYLALTGGTVTGAVIFQALVTMVDVDVSGDLSFSGAGKIAWTKIAADSVALDAGTSAEGVADLQTANDGNIYHITEVAAIPGQTLVVSFVSVTSFNWVNIIAGYDGLPAHGMTVELYNWGAAGWDMFNNLPNVSTNTGTILSDRSFFVPDCTAYVGTGGSAGLVDVRLNHPVLGIVTHDSYVDVVALYQ